MSYVTGVGLTSYGKHEGSSSLDLMSKAAASAIADAGQEPGSAVRQGRHGEPRFDLVAARGESGAAGGRLEDRGGGEGCV